MTDARSVAPYADVGSSELAAALAAGDAAAVERALQSSWVIVPLTPRDGGTALRLIEGLDPDRPGWELPLFSSVAASDGA
ncbi:MAG: hypothetical protein EOO67_10525 [Microbacterium sp.]|nr:MAG: hypothetical protein EOO67_10525 [Microbacterium sp.]